MMVIQRLHDNGGHNAPRKIVSLWRIQKYCWGVIMERSNVSGWDDRSKFQLVSTYGSRKLCSMLYHHCNDVETQGILYVCRESMEPRTGRYPRKIRNQEQAQIFVDVYRYVKYRVIQEKNSQRENRRNESSYLRG